MNAEERRRPVWEDVFRLLVIIFCLGLVIDWSYRSYLERVQTPPINPMPGVHEFLEFSQKYMSDAISRSEEMILQLQTARGVEKVTITPLPPIHYYHYQEVGRHIEAYSCCCTAINGSEPITSRRLLDWDPERTEEELRRRADPLPFEPKPFNADAVSSETS